MPRGHQGRHARHDATHPGPHPHRSTGMFQRLWQTLNPVSKFVANTTPQTAKPLQLRCVSNVDAVYPPSAHKNPAKNLNTLKALHPKPLPATGHWNRWQCRMRMTADMGQCPCRKTWTSALLLKPYNSKLISDGLVF